MTYSSGGIGVVDFGVAPTKEWTKRSNLGGGGGEGGGGGTQGDEWESSRQCHELTRGTSRTA